MNDESSIKILNQILKLKIVVGFLSAFSTSNVFAYSGYLQVGVFNKAANAKQMQAYIEHSHKYPMSIKQSFKKNKPNKAIYTVVIEGFKSRTDAVKLQAFLKKKGYQCLLKSLSKQQQLYRIMPYPAVEQARVANAYRELALAKKNPEYLLGHELNMPTSPKIEVKPSIEMSMRDAILLSLRYSSDLQSAELNRIVVIYQTRIEENAFEMQYALNGTNNFSWSKSLGANQGQSQIWNLNHSASIKSGWGTTVKATVNHSYDGNDYSPQMVLSLAQPLLRGMGPTVVEQSLNNQRDQELQNKMSLRQFYIDKVTTVISSYRSLIRQNNSYKTQRKSLKDAEYIYWVNKKRIAAGELESTGNIQQEYQVSNLSVTLERQGNQLRQSRRSFLQLLGLDLSLVFSVPDNIEVSSMKVPKQKVSIEYAFKHNTSYQNSLISYRIIKRAYKVALNQQLWELNLTASQTYGASSAFGQDTGLNNITNGRNQANQLGLSLSVPINDLPRRSTLISAKVSLEKARLGLIAQKRQLETDVINKIINIKTHVSVYKMDLKRLSLAQRSYNIETKKREAGISTSLNVTNTQNQLIQAQNSLIISKISYLEGISSLEQLLGTTLDVWQINIGQIG